MQRGMLNGLKSVVRCAAALGLISSCLPLPASAQVKIAAPRRFVVSTPRSTVVTGRPFDVSVELQDDRGRKLNAPSTIDIVLTITTLPTLQAARVEAGKQPKPSGSPTTLDNKRFALAAGQTVLRVPATFPQRQGDLDFTVTTNTAGDLRIFVEAAVGAQVQAGSILVIAAAKLLKLPRSEPAGIVRIVWQPPPAPSGRLKFKDSGEDVVLEGRDFVRPFWVVLHDANGQPIAPPAGTPIQVLLSVTKGSARFDPQTLTIPPDTALSNERAALRSSVGGTVEMWAQSVGPNIAEAREPFTFELGVRTTRLEVRPISSSALANGLDPVAVEVKAVFAEGDQTRIMTAADENLQSRRVSISFKGGSARLKDGATELVIPPTDNRGVIEVFSSRRSRKLTLLAESTNGFGQIIDGSTEIEFELPWVQLACAIGGGLLLPLILRAPVTHVLVGAASGAMLYILMFFGAVVTAEQRLGKVAVAITKLPTENVFAGFALGVLGYLLISPVLGRRPARAPAARRAAR